MSNVVSGIFSALKLEVDNEPKAPLNIGEAMACWTYLALMDEATSFMLLGLNSSQDDDVSKVLKESMKQCKAQSTKLREFMIREGVHFPQSPEEKLNLVPDGVPLGAKMTDNEMINSVALKTATAVIHCATTATQSIRNDVSVMFIQFMNEKLVLGTNLKTLMKIRGWIKVPPYYYPPGVPTH